MDSSEFFEWIQYYQLEPWGSIVDGYRNASTGLTLANIASGFSGKKGKRFKIENFLIGVDRGEIQKPKGSVARNLRDAFLQFVKKDKKNDNRKT